MATRYSELYLGDELIKLRDGLEVLERVIDSETLKILDLWLYGVITDDFILDIAKEAIIAITEDFMDEEGNSSVNESDIALTEIAVAVPLYNPDHIDMLYGSGFPLGKLVFAYQAGEGEGIRTVDFFHSDTAHNSSATVKIDKMGDKALAESDMYLDEYFKDKNKGSMMQVQHKVQRDEPATESIPSEPAKPTNIQSSIKISSLVEKFLG